MTLKESIVAEFMKGLTEVFEKEKNSKYYMNQTILGCRWRAFWGVVVACISAIPDMTKILAMSIAKHRESDHGEDKSRTIRSLTRSMSDEQIKASTSSSFWNS